MFMGLLPKDSLFAWLPCLVLLLTTSSLGSAALATVFFSIASRLLDPLAHPLGGMILTANGLERFWGFLYELPVIPWTRFNNTVVLGQLVLSCLLAIPVYVLSTRFVEAYGQQLHERLSRRAVYRWMIASPIPESVEETG